jgi:hypothetical protein
MRSMIVMFLVGCFGVTGPACVGAPPPPPEHEGQSGSGDVTGGTASPSLGTTSDLDHETTSSPDHGTTSSLDHGTTDEGSDQPVECGNGIREWPEACDSSDFGGQACSDLGFDSGMLSCSSECTIDAGDCSTCGDGEVQGQEECDGQDLGDHACSDWGFWSGTLACTPSCELNQEECYSCGDQQLDGPEICDWTNLGGVSCADLGYDQGSLSCVDDCMSFDDSACMSCGCQNPSNPDGSLPFCDRVCDGTQQLWYDECGVVNYVLDCPAGLICMYYPNGSAYCGTP